MFSSKKWEECSVSSPGSNLRKLCIIIIFVTLGYVPFVLACLSTCRLCSPACPRVVCARLPVHVPFVLACLSTHFSLIFTETVHLPNAKKRCATLDVPGWMCNVQKKSKVKTCDVGCGWMCDVETFDVVTCMYIYFQIHDLFAMNALLLQT